MISNVVVHYQGKNKYVLNWKSKREVAIYLLMQPDDEVSEFLVKTNQNQAEVMITKCLRPYFLLKDDDNQLIAATRVVPLDGPNNFRDLGGYLGADGKRVKWGKLFRSDHLHRLTENDKAVLDEIGLKTVVDYRSPDEYQAQPNQKWRALKNISSCTRCAKSRFSS